MSIKKVNCDGTGACEFCETHLRYIPNLKLRVRSDGLREFLKTSRAQEFSFQHPLVCEYGAITAEFGRRGIVESKQQPVATTA